METPPAGETLFRLLGVRNGPSVLIRGTPVNYPPRFTHVCSILGSHATLSHRAHIERWIDFAFTKGDPLVKYQEQHFAGGNGVVNWEDIRIRPFSLEERTNNLQWLGSAEDLFVLEKMLEVYGQKNDKVCTSCYTRARLFLLISLGMARRAWRLRTLATTLRCQRTKYSRYGTRSML